MAKSFKHPIHCTMLWSDLALFGFVAISIARLQCTGHAKALSYT